MTKKEHFKLMYDLLDVDHKGIKLNKVLCSLLMFIAGGNKIPLGNFKTLTKFLRVFDLSEFNSSNIKEALVTFGQYYNRNDHKQLMQEIVYRLGENVTFFDTTQWNTRKLRISASNIIKSLRLGFSRMKGTGLSIMDRLLLSSQICFYLNTIDSLANKEFPNTSKFLCLANSLDLENLLTQLLKQKGIKTYSLMEGVYFYQESDLPITDIAFFNLTSDIQLCWGQYSKDELIKYGYAPDKMIVAGYPKNVSGRSLKQSNSFTKAVVLLSQYVMEEQNQALIKILSKFADKIEFSLKLHPTLDFEAYSNIASKYSMKIVPKDLTLNDCVDNDRFDFAVAINSTAYYEALMRGLPCLRFYDRSYTPMSGCDDEFDSVDTFRKQLNKIKGTPTQQYQNEVDNALEYAVGWGIDEYQRILS